MLPNARGFPRSTLRQMLGFLDELAWRGLLHQTTAETLPAYLATPGRIAYAGFDPTADSLTVGNYVPMKLLAHWLSSLSQWANTDVTINGHTKILKLQCVQTLL